MSVLTCHHALSSAGAPPLRHLCELASVDYPAARMTRMMVAKLLVEGKASGVLPLACEEITLVETVSDANSTPTAGESGLVTLANMFESSQRVNQNVSVVSRAYAKLFHDSRMEIDERYVYFWGC